MRAIFWKMDSLEGLPVARSRFPLLYDKTMIYSQSTLTNHLQTYYDEVVRMPQKRLAKKRLKVEKLLSYIFPRMKTLAAKSGLRLKQPVLSGSIHEKLDTLAAHEFDVLFPFDKDRSRISRAEHAGYSIIQLKKPQKGGGLDAWRYGRSMDGLYLSPLQVHNTLHKLLGKVITVPVKVPNVELESLLDDSGYPGIRFRLGADIKINIIPAIIPTDDDNPVLVARPYTYDVEPRSDRLWRLHHGNREQEIVSLMDSADRGCRKQAFRILKTLFQKERTLRGLTSYHIKTVLLYNFDEDVDARPTWQRERLDICILSMLRDLLDFLRAGKMPHFFLSDYDLLAIIPRRVVHNLRNRLAYIIQNENDFIRILRKRDSKVQYKTRKSLPKDEPEGLTLEDKLRKYRQGALQSSGLSILVRKRDSVPMFPTIPSPPPLLHEISDHSLDSCDVSLPDIYDTRSKASTPIGDSQTSVKNDTPD